MLDPVLDSTARLDAAALTDAESAENFPVALRLLPTKLRRELRAVYGVARPHGSPSISDWRRSSGTTISTSSRSKISLRPTGRTRRSRRTAPGTTCTATAGSPPNRSGASCWR